MARDDLDAVESGADETRRRRRVTVDDLLYLGQRQGTGNDTAALVGHRRRRHADAPRAAFEIEDLAPGVEELPEQFGAKGVHGQGQSLIAIDARVVSRHEHVARVARTLVHTRDLGDDETHPAFGPSVVIGHELISDESVLDHHGVVARRDDAVGDRDRTKGERRREKREESRRVHLLYGATPRARPLSPGLERRPRERGPHRRAKARLSK